jgi:hypothetical protein
VAVLAREILRDLKVEVESEAVFKVVREQSPQEVHELAIDKVTVLDCLLEFHRLNAMAIKQSRMVRKVDVVQRELKAQIERGADWQRKERLEIAHGSAANIAMTVHRAIEEA